jgi:hypothetical protein
MSELSWNVSIVFGQIGVIRTELETHHWSGIIEISLIQPAILLKQIAKVYLD